MSQHQIRIFAIVIVAALLLGLLAGVVGPLITG